MMLRFLKINNIALIDEVKIEFLEGLNVLSGETGAGKSIIIDSLSFVLGGKFDKTLIRQGQDFACVSAFFEEVSDECNNLMDELGLEKSNEILLYRKAGSKNEAKINGQNVPLSILKQVAQCLVDIHGQNENQRILSPKNQLEVIDAFCGPQAKKLKAEIGAGYGELIEIENKIKDIGGNRADREKMLDFLKFQVDEIESAKLKENEDEILAAKLEIQSQGEKISESLNEAISLLGGANSLDLILSSAMSSLSPITKYDPKLAKLYDRLKSCKIESLDILEEMESYRSSLDFNEIEFNKIDSRLDKIKSLKKKYGGSITEILSFLEKAKKQIDETLNSEEILNELENAKTKQEQFLLKKSAELSEIRKQQAQVLEEKIKAQLSSLAMQNAKFKVLFKDCALSKNGTDEVEFLFSANSGQDIKPLGKIISGGEMSRFCLALKTITFENDEIGTMVFDEIDTGISGKVAEVVATKMVAIGTQKQVLVITHLPQVVAVADTSLLIEKFESESLTKTTVKILNEEEHISEVARLIGQNMSSTHANLHAKDLIEYGKNLKKSLKGE